MGILEFFRPGSRRRGKKPSPGDELGVSGLVIHGGYVASVEENSKLVDSQRWKTYSDVIANISTVAASLRFWLRILCAAEWTVQVPDPESREQQDLADLLTDIMHNCRRPWHRIVRRSALYVTHGFSLQEMIAKKRDDGAIGLYDVATRPQATIEKWDVDNKGRVIGAIQRSPQDYSEIYLPIGRCVYLVDDTLSDSPYGIGLMRHVVPPAQRLKRYEYLEAIAYESDLRGIPIMRAPLAELSNSNLTTAEREARLAPYKSLLASHIRAIDSGMLLDSSVYRDRGDNQSPSGQRKWDFELLRGDGHFAEPIHNSIERLKRDVTRIFGTEGMMLGDGSAGSFALSTDKTNNLKLSTDGTLREIEGAYNDTIVRWLADLNGWPVMPKIKVNPLSNRDISQIAQALAALSTAGAPLGPDDPAIDEVRAVAGLSPAPDMGEI